jgi:hypothetical protein
MPSEPLRDALRASATAYASYLFAHPPAAGSYDLVALVQRRFPNLTDDEAVNAAHAAIEASLSAHMLGRLPPGQVLRAADVPVDPTLPSGYRYQVSVTVTDRGGQVIRRTLSLTSPSSLSMSDLESEAIEWASTQASDSPPGGGGRDPLRAPYVPIEIDVVSVSRSPSES